MLNLVFSYNKFWFEQINILGYRNIYLKKSQLILGVPVTEATLYLICISLMP